MHDKHNDVLFMHSEHGASHGEHRRWDVLIGYRGITNPDWHLLHVEGDEHSRQEEGQDSQLVKSSVVFR